MLTKPNSKKEQEKIAKEFENIREEAEREGLGINWEFVSQFINAPSDEIAHKLGCNWATASFIQKVIKNKFLHVHNGD
jgi:hypothetical protein